MLTSIAAIATTVTGLIGIFWYAVAAVKKNAEKKKTDSIQSINSELKKPLTDEEREKLQNALNDIVNS